MKALSLKQPFAILVVEGRKTIELRVWNTKLRGPFLVHASRTPFKDQYEKFGYKKDSLPLGAIIGVVNLLDVKEYSTSDEWRQDFQRHLAGPEFEARDYGFILSCPVKFEKPIPCAGSLNFWNVSESIMSKLPRLGDNSVQV